MFVTFLDAIYPLFLHGMLVVFEVNFFFYFYYHIIHSLKTVYLLKCIVKDKKMLWLRTKLTQNTEKVKNVHVIYVRTLYVRRSLRSE